MNNIAIMNASIILPKGYAATCQPKITKAQQSQNIEAPDFMADSSKSGSIPTRIKSQINKKIMELGNYHEQIPLGTIQEILKEHEIIMLQEDNTPWSGFLVGGAECGSEKTKDQVATFPLAVNSNGQYVVTRNGLYLSWCKMPSGKYEIVAYIS